MAAFQYVDQDETQDIIVEPDNAIEGPDNAIEQLAAAIRQLANTDNRTDTIINQTISINYLINEIKSQEDTARQIISICILLIGISLTIFTSSVGNLMTFTLLYENSTHIHQVPVDNSFMSYLKLIWNTYVFIFNLFIAWLLALDTAGYALRSIYRNDYDRGALEEIAKEKRMYLSHTFKIIRLSILGLLALLAVIHIMHIVQSTQYSQYVDCAYIAWEAYLVFLGVITSRILWHWPPVIRFLGLNRK